MKRCETTSSLLGSTFTASSYIRQMARAGKGGEPLVASRGRIHHKLPTLFRLPVDELHDLQGGIVRNALLLQDAEHLLELVLSAHAEEGQCLESASTLQVGALLEYLVRLLGSLLERADIQAI